MFWRPRARKHVKKVWFLPTIKLTGDAERDLINIYLQGIEQIGSAQAERYSGGLNARITFIAAIETGK